MIDATPQIVFDAATNVQAWPEVIDDIVSVEVLTEGPVGQGTVFRETRVMFGKEATEQMTFQIFDRPHRYVTTASSGGNDYVATTILEPVPTGTCMRIEFKSTPRKAAAWLLLPLGWLFKRFIRKCLIKDLSNLKSAIERNRQ